MEGPDADSGSASTKERLIVQRQALTSREVERDGDEA